MSNGDLPQTWPERARTALALYREELLRQVSTKLTRPRQRRSADELREQIVESLDDPIAIDRALKTVQPVARKLLALIDFSSNPSWSLQSLVDLLPVVGFQNGIGPIQELLETGLLYPNIGSTLPLESFETWLAQAATEPLRVFTIPLVAERCRAEPLELDSPSGEKLAKLVPIETDGLEWPLRLMIVWQIVHDNSIRVTQAGGYFKRDLDRLRANPLLASQPSETPVPVSDPAMLAVELGRQVGLLRLIGDELVAAPTPTDWMQDHSVIGDFWRAMTSITNWDPLEGLITENGRAKRTSSLGLALLSAMAAAPLNHWHNPDELAEWISQRQPDFGRELKVLAEWCRAYLLGLMHSLKMTEVAKSGNDWRVRLTTEFRERLAVRPTKSQTATPTLLVQPNLEIILYRQGLTAPLAGNLTCFAEWKQLGLACTLTLTSDSVYRGLESGLSLSDITRCLERHSTRPLSDSVLETLRSWSSKRERVQVYSSAMLLEFRNAVELQQAVKQGLVEQALTDRVGLVASESQLDYSRFRLVGTRDYLAPEERCVEVENDDLTLSVQVGKADLLLSAEVRRFADPVEAEADDRSMYQMTIESLRRARNAGVELRWMDEWFLRRTGYGVPATAKLLFLGANNGMVRIAPLMILQLPSEEVADGIEHWPAARRFLVERLGATTFVVHQATMNELSALLTEAEIVIAPTESL